MNTPNKPSLPVVTPTSEELQKLESELNALVLEPLTDADLALVQGGRRMGCENDHS